MNRVGGFPVSLGPNESGVLRFSSGGFAHSNLCYTLFNYVLCRGLSFLFSEPLCVLD